MKKRDRLRTQLGVVAKSLKVYKDVADTHKWYAKRYRSELTEALAEIKRIRQFRVYTPACSDMFLSLEMRIHKRDICMSHDTVGQLESIFDSMKAQLISAAIEEVQTQGTLG